MNRMYVANKALIENGDGKILLIRDAGIGDHATLAGLWDVPGGRMELQETPYEGLVREIKEEIGLDILPYDTRPFYVDKWGVNGDIVNKPIIGVFWIIALRSSDITLSAEHSEFQWADPHMPPTPLMPPVGRAFTFLLTNLAISKR